MTAPIEQSSHYQALPKTTAVRIKVEQDIAFLTSQIAKLEQQAHPNNLVLDTYKMVLNSRHAVLEWLLQGSAGQTEQPAIEQYSA
jgi:hypothetical protein